LVPRFRRLLARKFRTAVALLTDLREAGVLAMGDDEIGMVSENIVLLQTHWLNYSKSRAVSLSETVVLHRGVFQMLSMLMPYLTEAHQSAYDDVKKIYHANVGSLDL
jgi:hypothetical protein